MGSYGKKRSFAISSKNMHFYEKLKIREYEVPNISFEWTIYNFSWKYIFLEEIAKKMIFSNKSLMYCKSGTHIFDTTSAKRTVTY